MTLTEKVLAARSKDGAVPKPVLEEVCAATLRYARESLHLSRDQAADEVSEFYPHIVRAIQSYRQEQTTFEAYLFTIFRLERKARRRRERRHSQIGRMVRSGALGYKWYRLDTASCLEESHVPYGRSPKVESRRTESIRKRLICAVVRNAALLSPSEIAHFANQVGVPEEWLTGIATCARSELYKSFARIEYYRTLRDRYFAIHLKCQLQLANAANPDERNKVLARIAMNQSRLGSVRRRISRVSTQLSHRRVGEILGLPKGSVDSCLAHLAQDGLRCPHENPPRKQQRSQVP